MNRFRKIAGSITLALILGVILLAFVLGDVAGVGGALRLAGSDPVISRIGGWHLGPITLGGTAIKGGQIRSEFDRELEQLNNRAGIKLSRDQAIMLGLPARALRNLEQRLLLDRAMADLGIVISDDQIRENIAQTPAFQGPDGKFSQRQYQAVLYNLRVSEAQYVADLRRDIGLSQMLGATGGVSMPKVLRDALYRYRREQRVAEVVLIDPARMTDVPAPTDEQIKAYYDANAKKFELPERRSLTFVTLTPEDVVGEVQVTEEQVRAYFKDRKPQLDKPGKRDLDQVLAKDEAEARRIAELVAGGKSLEEAGKEITGKEVSKIGVVTPSDLPADLAKAAFQLKAPGLVQPVKTSLGKRDIDQFLAKDEAEAKKIVELVAGGKSLEEAGKEVTGKEISKIGVVTPADLPGELAKAAFELREPGLLPPVKTGVGWHVARVNSIVEPAVWTVARVNSIVEPTVSVTFEDVQAQLERELRLQAAGDLVAKRTTDLEKALSRVDDLEAAAREFNLTLRKAEDVDSGGRDGAAKPLVEGPWASDLMATAFRLKQGETSALNETKAGHAYVVRADKVTPARTPTLEEAKDRVAAAWTEEERRKATVTRAREIADRANAVAELSALARTVRSEVKTSKPVTRAQSDAAAGLQGPLVAKLFELEPGKSAAVTTDEGAAVVRLREVVPADPATAPEEADKLGKELDRAAGNDLAAELVAALERRYGVERDAAAFTATFRVGSQQ